MCAAMLLTPYYHVIMYARRPQLNPAPSHISTVNIGHFKRTARRSLLHTCTGGMNADRNQ